MSRKNLSFEYLEHHYDRWKLMSVAERNSTHNKSPTSQEVAIVDQNYYEFKMGREKGQVYV